MANIIQRFIYNLSAAAPLSYILALVWYFQKGTPTVPIVCICIGTVLVICFKLSFSYGKKHIAPIAIRANDISPNDGWVVAYVVSYLLPFASIAVKDFDIAICGLIAAILIIIAPYINTAIPNPLLFCMRYHFYQVIAENGISGYVLISKRKLRKAKDLKTVRRVFEFLLLDSERR